MKWEPECGAGVDCMRGSGMVFGVGAVMDGGGEVIEMGDGRMRGRRGGKEMVGMKVVGCGFIGR